MDSILVKLECNNAYFGIRTFDRTHGRKGRYLIVVSRLKEILSTDASDVALDTDYPNIAVFQHRDGLLKVKLLWLTLLHNNDVIGFIQRIDIPDSLVSAVVNDHKPKSFLMKPHDRSSHIDTQGSASTIRNVLKSKYQRRAFSKAMRDSFQWGDEEVVTLTSDGKDDFYFTTKSGYPKNGGLILHQGIRKGHPSLFYSVHT